MLLWQTPPDQGRQTDRRSAGRSYLQGAGGGGLERTSIPSSLDAEGVLRSRGPILCLVAFSVMEHLNVLNKAMRSLLSVVEKAVNLVLTGMWQSKFHPRREACWGG